jgi:hypothetical protein
LEDVEKKYPPYVTAAPKGTTAWVINGVMSQVSDEEIQRYEKARKKYLDDYSKILRLREELRHSKKSRFLELEIVIKNKRNNIEDACIVLHFPDEVRVVDSEEIPQDLDDPDSPVWPRRLGDMITMIPSLHDLAMPQINLSEIGTQRNVSGFDIRETKSWEVEFTADYIAHHSELSCGVLCLIYNAFEEVKPFNMTYTIHATNIPIVIKGKIKIQPVKIGLTL